MLLSPEEMNKQKLLEWLQRRINDAQGDYEMSSTLGGGYDQGSMDAYKVVYQWVNDGRFD